jgi:hypothetical protein
MRLLGRARQIDSHMLARGVHPNIARGRPKLSRLGIAFDCYSHAGEGLQGNAVALVDEAMTEALDKRGKRISTFG